MPNVSIRRDALAGGPGAGSSLAELLTTRVLGGLIALTSMFAIWYALSIAVRPWIPTPKDTAFEVWKFLQAPDFWFDFRLTMLRVLASFLVATIIGSLIGVLIGLNRRAEAFFQPLLALALAVPDPVYIIFAILAFGTGETAGFVALTIAVAPFVSNIVCSSVHARDNGLDEMARIYRLSPGVRFRACLLPQLVPAFLTAMRFSFALSWKLVVVVEAIGQPHGIGAAIFESFRVLRMREVFAIAIIFIFFMQVLERGVLARIEKKLLLWRH